MHSEIILHDRVIVERYLTFDTRISGKIYPCSRRSQRRATSEWRKGVKNYDQKLRGPISLRVQSRQRHRDRTL